MSLRVPAKRKRERERRVINQSVSFSDVAPLPPALTTVLPPSQSIRIRRAMVRTMGSEEGRALYHALSIHSVAIYFSSHAVRDDLSHLERLCPFGVSKLMMRAVFPPVQ